MLLLGKPIWSPQLIDVGRREPDTQSQQASITCIIHKEGSHLRVESTRNDRSRLRSAASPASRWTPRGAAQGPRSAQALPPGTRLPAASKRVRVLDFPRARWKTHPTRFLRLDGLVASGPGNMALFEANPIYQRAGNRSA